MEVSRQPKPIFLFLIKDEFSSKILMLMSFPANSQSKISILNLIKSLKTLSKLPQTCIANGTLRFSPIISIALLATFKSTRPVDKNGSST